MSTHFIQAEQLMAEHHNVRRLPDGSIDFYFYRRRAARQRRLIKRLMIGRSLALIGRGLEAAAIAIGSYRLVLPALRSTERASSSACSSHRA